MLADGLVSLAEFRSSIGAGPGGSVVESFGGMGVDWFLALESTLSFWMMGCLSESGTVMAGGLLGRLSLVRNDTGSDIWL